jgi:hypothetical protein
MPGSTTRRGLPTPLGTDAVSEFRLAITAVANAADTDSIYLSGTLAACAGLSGLVAGTLYWATDTALLYEYNGTAWQTVMLAGPWIAMGPGGGWNLATGWPAPVYRIVGDRVELRGAVENGLSSTIASGSTVLTGLPAPAHQVGPTVNSNIDVTCVLNVSSGATTAALLGIGMPSGCIVIFDGSSYPLS